MTKITIEGEHSIEVKRFYVPYTIKAKCPNCGNDVEFLGDYDYLSYPVLNAEEKVYACCDECDYEMELPIRVGMTLEYDVNSIKKQ
jgi:hypothetical protein